VSRVVHVLEFRMVRGTGGGPEKTILLGARAADPARTRVTVCYLRAADDEVFDIAERARALDVPYVEIVERRTWDTTLVPRLGALIDELGIDVVHSHDYKTDLLAWLAARRRRIAIVATAHGWTGHSKRERLVYYPGHKWLLARFPQVIAVSSEIKHELGRWGAAADRVTVLLNGIDPGRFRRDPSRVSPTRDAMGIRPDAVVLGAVGRLEPQKRFDLLIDAFETLRRTRSEPLLLLIAGEGSARSALEAQIARLGLGTDCRLLGQLSEITAFHHALDLFVQSSDYEGTPNVVLEAMAMETPVVATSVGGTADICRPGLDGEILPPGDVGILTAGISRVLGDHALRVSRTASARHRVEQDLSFERRVRALDDLYEEMATPS